MSAPSHPAARGFYVFQAALGSPLQFHPALGTSELDTLVEAYLPYSATIQDKRASISVDFFEHFRCTGESIKFYQVPDWINSATSSPNSIQDSGYGSSFTASPLAPTWSWGALDTPAASTPSTSSSASTPQINSRRRKHSTTGRRSAPSRTNATDFSDLPGMKILTKDGRDVTNTATRGCKTKEQRDHAHLMRIMKACDSCKRKKVRCDPSHRARTSPVSPAELPARSAKKPKISAQKVKPAAAVPSFDPVAGTLSSLPPLPDSFELDPFDFLNETPVNEQTSWDEFLSFNDELDSIFPQELVNLPDYNLPDPHPSMPTVPQDLPVVSGYPDSNDAPLVPPQQTEAPVQDSPKLPYLEENDEPHHYMDFNLYSPASSFSDTEPSPSADASVDSSSRTGVVMRPAGGLNGSEQLQRSRPQRYPDIRSPDHIPDPSSSGLSTGASTNSATAPLRVPTVCLVSSQRRSQGLRTSQDLHEPSYTAADRQTLLTTDGGFVQRNANAENITMDASLLWSPDHRVGRTVDETEASKEVCMVSSGKSSVVSLDLSRSQLSRTTRESDFARLATTSQTATREIEHSDVDERGSCDSCGKVQRHRSFSTEFSTKRNVESTTGTRNAATAPSMSNLGNENVNLKSCHNTTASKEGTALPNQKACAMAFVSPLKPSSLAPAIAASSGPQPGSMSHLGALVTGLSTEVWAWPLSNTSTTSLWNLLSTAAVLAMLTVTVTVACMAVASTQSRDVARGVGRGGVWASSCAVAYLIARDNPWADSTSSSIKAWQARRPVARIEAVLSRIAILA